MSCSASWLSFKHSSITNAFLVYCFLPIGILILINTIANKNEVVARIVVGNAAGAGDGIDNINNTEGTDSETSLHHVNVEQNQASQSRKSRKVSSSSWPSLSLSSSSQQTQKKHNNQSDNHVGRSAKPRAINGMISKLRADHRVSNVFLVLTPQQTTNNEYWITNSTAKHLHLPCNKRNTKNDTNDMYKALALADALLERDRMHHDGGTQIVEAFDYGEFL